MPCLLCCTNFTLMGKDNIDGFLQHLLSVHKLVIGDVNLIADFQLYISYWKNRFLEAPITDFCTAIKTNCDKKDKAPQELYYLLCDVLPEDKQIRNKLQKNTLDKVLTQQQKERNDMDFSRGCLFCREHFDGNRTDLFTHMVVEHNFNVGQPDNLVYVNEFLDLLNDNLHSLQCLYCEKIFKDRFVLKEHMRKKGHKKINPRNKTYDKFYIVNYLEIGKNWEMLQSEEDDNQSDMSLNDDWSDWQCDIDLLAVCLFCDHKLATVDGLFTHMKEQHDFDLEKLKLEENLTFYQQIKLVNYIRRQMYQNTCMYCHLKCVTRVDLLLHWDESSHSGKVPPVDQWDHPQYYFPTYEDDNLLCVLDDTDDTNSGVKVKDNGDVNVNSMVIPEDFTIQQSVLKDTSILKDLVAS